MLIFSLQVYRLRIRAVWQRNTTVRSDSDNKLSTDGTGSEAKITQSSRAVSCTNHERHAQSVLFNLPWRNLCGAKTKCFG